MKRYALLFCLTAAVLLAGCSYAPGNEREPFIEKWLRLPSIEFNDYQSSRMPEETQSLSTEPTEISGTIEAPVVDLDDLPPRSESDLVRVKDYIPDAVVDIQYATANNFTGTVVYDYGDAYLRYGTVLKLMEVQKELRGLGYRLKIWDSFRTMEAQKFLYEKSGGQGYSNPNTGNNSHSRGNTVDVTLINAQGVELEMPTPHDVFNSFSDRDFSDCTEKAAENASLLQDIMLKYGFTGLRSEWWQYSDTVEYEVETCFDPGEMAVYYAACNEYINIRSLPTYDAGAIGQIRANEKFTLLGWAENNFALIEYEGQRGYVNVQYIAKAE